MVDLEARERIQALETQGVQRDREIADLSGRLSRLAATLDAIRSEVGPRVDSPAIPPNPPSLPAPAAALDHAPITPPQAPLDSPARVPAPAPPPAKSAVSPDAASRSPAVPPNPPSLQAVAAALPASDAPIAPLGLPARPPAARPPPATSAVSSAPAGKSPAFASKIVPEFPALFAEAKKKKFGRDKPPGFFVEFHGKQLSLLWRGSRDGFGGGGFHDRCDDHENTLTLIEDTEGNIFGGFTPVEWESSNSYKADPSLKSFLFTLKNPHNFPAKKFALKAEKKHDAIYCASSRGPYFCGGIAVRHNCNANTDSYTEYFGDGYANDTGLAGSTFFTGSERFRVKEIEVFEITD
jgi:hypothetical protein